MTGAEAVLANFHLRLRNVIRAARTYRATGMESPDGLELDAALASLDRVLSAIEKAEESK